MHGVPWSSRVFPTTLFGACWCCVGWRCVSNEGETGRGKRDCRCVVDEIVVACGTSLLGRDRVFGGRVCHVSDTKFAFCETPRPRPPAREAGRPSPAVIHASLCRDVCNIYVPTTTGSTMHSHEYTVNTPCIHLNFSLTLGLSGTCPTWTTTACWTWRSSRSPCIYAIGPRPESRFQMLSRVTSSRLPRRP